MSSDVSEGENMFFKSKGFQLGLAFALGIVVLLLPRPEGTKFRITGDRNQTFFQHISQHFTTVSTEKGASKGYTVVAKKPVMLTLVKFTLLKVKLLTKVRPLAP